LCQAPLASISRLPVCDDCLRRLHPIAGPLCAACGERLTSVHLSERDGAPLCGMCLQNEPVFTRAAAYGSYQEGLRDLLHLLKYQHVRPAAGVLGRMLAEVIADLAEAFGSQPPVVIAVPLHPAKLRQRGFNQSELIARAALKLRPAALDVNVNTAVLARHKATESQTGLTPQQRRENLRGAFRVQRPAEIQARDVLLVDDVFTTGATVSECARVLRRAGAERVFVATVARVLKPEAARVAPPEELEKPVSLAAHA
jgi:ComF family protein